MSIDLAIMLEGQNGVNWDNFREIATLVDDAGFAGLYRSDHFTNASAPDKDSLELWVSLTWLASHTKNIDFGPLVTPVSFRDPVFTARMGRDVDDLSGGRLHLGVGAGWQEREHEKFGYDLLDLDGRFARFEEGLQVITRLLHSDDPVDFDGDYYDLNEAQLVPRPERDGGPPILVGGNGMTRTLPLAARYADMWNAVYLSPVEFEKRVERLGELLAEEGRGPDEMHMSMMTGLWYGTADAIQQRVDDHPRFDTVAEVRERGVVVGTAGEVVEQIGALEEAGVQRVMLQWLDLEDIAGLESLAADVLPHFK